MFCVNAPPYLEEHAKSPHMQVPLKMDWAENL